MRSATALVALCALCAQGCATLGPEIVSGSRSAYNAAVQQSANEEMLLNIVRLRYRDTPYFLQVSGIAANMTTSVGLNGGASVPSSGASVGNLGATAAIEDNPTITFTPLQGEQFSKQLLSPVSLDTVFLLVESGWSIERVLRLCAQRLNDVPNAPSASGPTPLRAPRHAEFDRIASALRALQERDAIGFAIDREADGLAMIFRRDEAGSPEAREIAARLGLHPGLGRYLFTTTRAEPGGDRIAIETRSLMASLFFLSQAVRVPDDDVARGLVAVTRNADGSLFDWSALMRGFFRIEPLAGKNDPHELTASYRGERFGIRADDLSSKATFALLDQLFALQASASSQGAPLLTLPVSR